MAYLMHKWTATLAMHCSDQMHLHVLHWCGLEKIKRNNKKFLGFDGLINFLSN
jgi:hypothetical protein